MRIAAFSTWLGCLASTTFAFSSLHSLGRLSATSQTTPSVSHSGLFKSSTPLQVASTDAISVADMERGVGGRIESAFEAAKTKGEAAFVTFITAGYPNANGTFCVCFSALSTKKIFKYLFAFLIRHLV